MAKSITFSNFNLQDDYFRTRDIIYRTQPVKVIDVVQKSRRDGFFLQNTYYSEKIIDVTGTLTRDTKANLRTSLNSMKEALNNDEANLDIDDGGTTIRYICCVDSFEVQEEFYHITQIPYHIIFKCQPFGKETTITTNSVSLTSSPVSSSIDPTGSAPPLPIIRWTCNGAPDAAITAIEFENSTTGDSITISNLLLDASGDYLEIDCDEMTVKVSYDGAASTEIDFTGVFPSFVASSNNWTTTVTGGGSSWNLTQEIEYYPSYL